MRHSGTANGAAVSFALRFTAMQVARPSGAERPWRAASTGSGPNHGDVGAAWQPEADQSTDRDTDQDTDDLLPGVDEDALDEDDLDTDRVTNLEAMPYPGGPAMTDDLPLQCAI